MSPIFLCIGQNRSVFIKERIICHGLNTPFGLLPVHGNASQTVPRSCAGRKSVETKPTGQRHTDSFLKRMSVNKHINISSPSNPGLAPSENYSSGRIEFQDHEVNLKTMGRQFAFHTWRREIDERAWPGCVPLYPVFPLPTKVSKGINMFKSLDTCGRIMLSIML